MATFHVNHFDFSGGVVNSDPSPLDYPPNAVIDGENCELVGKRYKTRKGSSYTTASAIAADTVRALEQVRFPTNETSYLIAQVGNKVYASNTQLPSSAATFSEIYDLGAGSGVLDFSTLNDRAILTEGLAKKPLVFAGCLASDGSDWAVPKNVLYSLDGSNWHDISSDVCDKDADTYASLNSFPTAGYIGICCDMPTVEGVYVEIESANGNAATLDVEGFDSSWDSISHTDGTASGGATFAQTGAVTFDSEFTTAYQSIYGVPGYWYRLSFSAQLDSVVAIRRILYKASCQVLQNIGDGTSENCMAFLYDDATNDNLADYTVKVSDNTNQTYAKINSPDSSVDNPGMTSSEHVYSGGLTKFNSQEYFMHDFRVNENAATLNYEYWNGTTWTSLSVTDGTSVGGVTLAQSGRVTWSTPTDWRENRPFDAYPRGYWVRCSPSATLSDTVYVWKVGLFYDPIAPTKHNLTITLRDRIILLNRPDAPDQMDISRALEEYGFSGADSSSLRVGGQDEIVAAVTAFNQGFIAKPDSWYLLNGYSTSTFAIERAESGGMAPCNQRVVVTGTWVYPETGIKQGIFYLNTSGAWHFSGLQAASISSKVNWWDETADNPRIDLDNLAATACGVYYPDKQWIIWAVPMITGSNTSQATNNRLVIYDLSHMCWLPLFTISAASLCVGYHYQSGNPGKRGKLGVYCGDYSGNIVRLFDPDTTTDADGTDVEAWFETGWNHYDHPEIEKEIRTFSVHGRGGLTTQVYIQGQQSASSSEGLDTLNDDSVDFVTERKPTNKHSRFFRFKHQLTSNTDLYGYTVEIGGIREWERM